MNDNSRMRSNANSSDGPASRGARGLEKELQLLNWTGTPSRGNSKTRLTPSLSPASRVGTYHRSSIS
ncbi:hypothetical protein J6590_091102 [Homalodisca vitripennis]|nr:hypothetical protein J6590_091102 [Homalodisca vitripennis]